MTPAPRHDGRASAGGFIALYTLAFMGTCLVLDRAPARDPRAEGQLAGRHRAGTAEPVAGHRDRRPGRDVRQPAPRQDERPDHVPLWACGGPGWRSGSSVGTLGVLVVAVAPNIPVVLVGWCVAQLFFNGLLAAHGRGAAGPGPGRRSAASCPVSWASACPSRRSAAPTWSSCSAATRWRCSWRPARSAALLIAPSPSGWTTVGWRSRTGPHWSLREFLSTFYVDPRRNPDFTWAFASRFLFVMAYAFLVTYQAYFLLEQIGSDEDDIPRQIFLGTLVRQGGGGADGGRWEARTRVLRKIWGDVVLVAADPLQQEVGLVGHQERVGRDEQEAAGEGPGEVRCCAAGRRRTCSGAPAATRPAGPPAPAAGRRSRTAKGR